MKEKRKSKVILADRDGFYLQRLKRCLERKGDMQVLGMTDSGPALLEMAKELQPDIILMDMQMPVMSGAEATVMIKKDHPGIRIIALTTFDDDETVSDALKSGCDGFLLKIISPEQLRTSLHAVMDGVGVFDDEAMARLRRREEAKAAGEFSERELSILRYICKGLSNKEIAEKLSLQPGTIKNLVSIMLNKTFCVSRTALARYALDNKLVKPDQE